MEVRRGNMCTLGHTQSQIMLSLALWGLKHLGATGGGKGPSGKRRGGLSHPTSSPSLAV